MDSFLIKLVWLLLFLCCNLALMVMAPRSRQLWLKLVLNFLMTAATTCFLFARHPVLAVALWVFSLAPLMVDFDCHTGRVRLAKLPVFIICQLIGTTAFTCGIWLMNVTGYETVAALCLFTAAMARQGIFPFHPGMVELCRCHRYPLVINHATNLLGIWALILAPKVLDSLAAFSPWLQVWVFTALLFSVIISLRQDDIRVLFAHTSLFLPMAGLLMLSAPFSGQTLYFLVTHVALVTGLGACFWLLTSRIPVNQLGFYHGYAALFPKLAAMFLIFTLGMLGAPGTMFFIAEDFLIYVIDAMGIGPELLILTCLALMGLALYRAYSHIFLGPRARPLPVSDLKKRELLGFAILLTVIFGFGVAPQVLVDVLR